MPQRPRPLLAPSLGTGAPQSVLSGLGAMSSGHSRGRAFLQAAPRVSTASIATRSVTVPTEVAATASTGPVSVTQGSTAASATWVSPTAPWLPGAEGPMAHAVPHGPLVGLGLPGHRLLLKTWGPPAGKWGDPEQIPELRETLFLHKTGTVAPSLGQQWPGQAVRALCWGHSSVRGGWGPGAGEGPVHAGGRRSGLCGCSLPAVGLRAGLLGGVPVRAAEHEGVRPERWQLLLQGGLRGCPVPGR